jgi:hypothetical protein
MTGKYSGAGFDFGPGAILHAGSAAGGDAVSWESPEWELCF